MSAVKITLSKSERQRLFAVVLPVASGKTVISKKLVDYRHSAYKEVQFIDTDSYVASDEKLVSLASDEATKELRLFPALKDEIFTLVKKHPDTKIVVLTSNFRFIDFMDIKIKRTTVLAPSLELFSKVVADVKDTEEMYAVQQSRENVLKKYPGLKYYATFEELEQAFVRIFDLVRRT